MSRSSDIAIFGQLQQDGNLWWKSRTIFFVLKKINDFCFKNHYEQLLWEERQVYNVKLKKKIVQKLRYRHLGAVAARREFVVEILEFSFKKTLNSNNCLQESSSAVTMGRKTGLECEIKKKGCSEAEISPSLGSCSDAVFRNTIRFHNAVTDICW